MIVVAAATGSSDFDGLANALEEPQPTIPAEFSIATPRERSPRGRTAERTTIRARRETNTVRGARAALALEKRTAPENVDAGIAPQASKRRSNRTQNNFSRELTADEILDIKLGQNTTNQLTKRKAIADGDPEPRVKERRKKASNKSKAKQLTADERLDILLGQKKFEQSAKKKAIADGDAPVATKNAPKLSAPAPAKVEPPPAEKKPEVVVGSKEMQFWNDLGAKQIINKILKDLKRPKQRHTLESMPKESLLKYVETKLSTVNKSGKQTRNRGVPY